MAITVIQAREDDGLDQGEAEKDGRSIRFWLCFEDGTNNLF